MINIRDFKDEYNNIIGKVFIISEQREDIRGIFQDISKIYLSNGEIVGVTTYCGNHDIYKNDKENWDIVEEVLRIFLDKYRNKFKFMINELKKDSMGNKIAEKIINDEIVELEEKVKSLKMMQNIENR